MSAQKKPAVKKAVRKVSPATRKASAKKPEKARRGTGAQSFVRTSAKRPAGGKDDLSQQDMIDAAGAGSYIVVAGKWVSVSPLYEKMTGYKKEELIGSRLLDHVHADDRGIVREKHTRNLKAGSQEPFEYRMIRKDGDIVWLLEVSGPVADNGKKALLGSVMDVSRLRQTEDVLDLKEERYRKILENMTDAYFENDLAGRITFVNDTVCKHLGYSREELIGMKSVLFQDEAGAKKTFEAYNRIYRTGEPVRDLESEFLRKDGSRGVYELTVDLIRDAKGAPVGFRGVSRDITERKRMENELRKSEARYRTILEEIKEGYGELDLKGTWMFVNEAGAQNIGYRPEEIIGKNFREVTDEATAKRMFELFNDVFRTGRSVKGLEVEFITKQGNRRVVEISGALVRDEEGHPVGFRGLSRDVTERKWAEDALLQSEAKYFSIIESLGEAYFETDLRGMTTFVNDKVCEDLGYTREELLRMSNRDVQDETSAKETYAVFNEVYETGRPVKAFHYNAIRKDGSRAVFEMSISLMRDAQGKPIGFRGLSRDITERKRIEDALRASEERSRTIIETIPDPYYEIDLKGRVTYINSAFVSMMGYTLADLQTIRYSTLLDEKNTAIVIDVYKTVYKTGLMMKNVELDLSAKTGEKRLVNLSVSLIRNTEGKPTGFHGIVRDITERKKAEELVRQSEQSLRQYSEQLEARVKERTTELEKAKVAAEAASRVKSDFMANISHEFQTPLNSVIGFTKVLQDRMFGELNDKQDDFVRYIAEAGASLSRIITEILDASRVSSGSIKLNYSLFSLVDVLAKTNQMLALPMQGKKQTLTVNVDLDADVQIEADEQKIQQVFFHLMSNAVKYTPDGGKIDVRAFRDVEEASRREGVRVAVTDNGAGIKAEDIPRLFQNFGTLESPYTRSGQGIGMGLALAKQLLELHGGSIRVESEAGKGSCFTVFLPLSQSGEPA